MKQIRRVLGEWLYKCKYGIIAFSVALIVCFSDLVTKSVTDGEVASLIDGFVGIVSSHNKGAAWSILSSHTWLLIVISIIFIIAILFVNWHYKGKNMLYAYAIGFILGGAICNLLDRIIFGYVRDFIKLEFIYFPIFNLADCAITIGVILLCIFLLFCTKTKELSQDKTADDINSDFSSVETKDAKINNNSDTTYIKKRAPAKKNNKRQQNE